MKATKTKLLVMVGIICLLVGISNVTFAAGILADVNNDSVVNDYDALLTLQYAVGLYHPSDEATFKATADVAPLDANGKPKGDGVINIFDSLAILRHVAEIDDWGTKVTVNSSGSIDASNANYAFTFQSAPNDYTYTIANFSVNDQLIFPVAAGRAPSVDNSSFTDGKVKLSLLSAGGGTITVELTNLTPEQDSQIFSVNSINALFGPGTVTQQ